MQPRFLETGALHRQHQTMAEAENKFCHGPETDRRRGKCRSGLRSAVKDEADIQIQTRPEDGRIPERPWSIRILDENGLMLAAYRSWVLINFLHRREDEVRAWTCKKK